MNPRRRRTAGPLTGRARVRSNVSLGQIVDRTAQAGFGFLTALLALVAVPFMGLSMPFGLTIALLGIQMAFGRSQPWLPQRVRRHVLTVDSIQWINRKLTRWTAGMERWIKPRLTILAHGPMRCVIGLGLIAQGIGLALPMPIPFSNWAFILPILIYAIGTLEYDGLLILIAHVITAAMCVLAVFFADYLWQALRDAGNHIAAWF